VVTPLPRIRIRGKWVEFAINTKGDVGAPEVFGVDGRVV